MWLGLRFRRVLAALYVFDQDPARDLGPRAGLMTPLTLFDLFQVMELSWFIIQLFSLKIDIIRLGVYT